MGVFKAYDIRGKYPQEINEDLFEKIGNNLNFFNVKKVLIGRDMRSSSPVLASALIRGMLDSGINVVDIGLASTPMVYQASHDLDVDMAVVVTASHNSKEYNGIKICKKNAGPITWEGGIKQLKDLVEGGHRYPQKDIGTLSSVDYRDRYVAYLCSFFDLGKSLKVVFDAGNGMGGLVDAEILSSELEVVELYTNLDGNFPNHEANPIKEETLKDLKEEVVKYSAALGIAFDGDADRIGFVDEKGNFVRADLVAAFLIDYLMKQYPAEQRYSYDLRSSSIIEEHIKEKGKFGMRTRIGHSYIKEIMLKENLFFGAELTGHFFFRFKDNMIYDSAIRSAIEIINAISKQHKPFSELIAEYDKYFKINETNFDIKDKDQKMKDIAQHYEDLKVEWIDGVSIYGEDWWCNVRASNTEDILRLNLEAKSQETLDHVFEKIKGLMSQ